MRLTPLWILISVVTALGATPISVAAEADDGQPAERVNIVSRNFNVDRRPGGGAFLLLGHGQAGTGNALDPPSNQFQAFGGRPRPVGAGSARSRNPLSSSSAR